MVTAHALATQSADVASEHLGPHAPSAAHVVVRPLAPPRGLDAAGPRVQRNFAAARPSTVAFAPAIGGLAGSRVQRNASSARPSTIALGSVIHGSRPGPRVQRSCSCDSSTAAHDECTDCRDKRLQLSRSGTAPAQAPPIVHDVLATPGVPLDPGTRATMEATLGRDLSRVRLHTDANAARSAQSINAHAYTVGASIVFNQGRYAPQQADGRQLLAHELVHTIQQSSAGQPPSRAQPLAVEPPDSAAEGEARRIAAATPAASGVRSALGPAIAAPAVQRQEGEEGEEGGEPPSTESLEREKVPDIGKPQSEEGCPKVPTGLGKLAPQPPCPTTKDCPSDPDADGPPFEFCLDSDVFRDSGALTAIASFVHEQPALTRFVLLAFASPEGGQTYNENLSCHRAKRASRALENAGVRSERIQICAFGPTMRFATPDRRSSLPPGQADEAERQKNRVVIIHAQAPPMAERREVGSDPNAILAEAIRRLTGGDYRQGADAYVSRWSCGRVSSVAEMVQLTQITIEGVACDNDVQKRLGRFVTQDPRELSKHPFSTNAIALDICAVLADDPLGCAMARITDMAFHYVVRLEKPDKPMKHPAGLFLVELAGLLPCASRSAVWWARVRTDPLQSKSPTCAVTPLPGAVGKPAPEQLRQATPVLEESSVLGRSGTIEFHADAFAALMASAAPPFTKSNAPWHGEARVRVDGDPKAVPDYEVGWVQTVVSFDSVNRYVSGARVSALVPVPVRDGPTAGSGAAPPPPWFDPTTVVTANASGIATTRMFDAPSQQAPLVITAASGALGRNDVLDRMVLHTVFHLWPVARRKGAPLDRFNTIWLGDGGTSIDFSMRADVVVSTDGSDPKGSGRFTTRFGYLTDPTSMQLRGPVANETTRLRFERPDARDPSRGLSLSEFGAHVAAIARPHCLRLGLTGVQIQTKIVIDRTTGHVLLDAPSSTGSLSRGAIVVAPSDRVPEQKAKNLAVSIFPEVRKLVLGDEPQLAPGDDPRGTTATITLPVGPVP